MSSGSVIIDPRKLQHVYAKHAADFGVVGAWSPANGVKPERAIRAHVADPAVLQIPGFYRGTISVTHHYHPSRHLNVMVDAANYLVSGWILGPSQVANLLRSRNIQ